MAAQSCGLRRRHRVATSSSRGPSGGPARSPRPRDLPDQLRLDQGLADHELPDQELPDQLLPDHELPDQLLPDQELPDHELPDQELPFQTPPDQELALASAAAIRRESNGIPKMSCSPARTTPSRVRCSWPRES